MFLLIHSLTTKLFMKAQQTTRNDFFIASSNVMLMVIFFSNCKIRIQHTPKAIIWIKIAMGNALQLLLPCINVFCDFLSFIDKNMLDIILSPSAVIRKLIFPSPLDQNVKETKTICTQKRKLINVAQTKPISYMYLAFGIWFILSYIG